MDKRYYGEFGGQFVSETLMNTLSELETAFEEAIHDPKFMEEYHYYLRQYVGRETPLYYAERLSEKYGTKIYLKREDLNHTGAHKINNVIDQNRLTCSVCRILRNIGCLSANQSSDIRQFGGKGPRINCKYIPSKVNAGLSDRLYILDADRIYDDNVCTCRTLSLQLSLG